MLPNSYVVPAVQAINVFTYGATGNGTTLDVTAIQNAATALTPGQGLFFPATGSTYFVGPTSIDLPPQCSLFGVAGHAALSPARSTLVANNGLALCGDWTGNLSASAGHIFDAGGGRTFYSTANSSVYAGPAVPGHAANEYLVFFERFAIGATQAQAGVSTGWTDDNFASMQQSDFIVWTGATGEDFLDPCGVILPNGHILVSVSHNQTSTGGGSLQVYQSVDGGRSWTKRIDITPANTAIQYFSDTQLIRIRQAGTGSATTRMALVFMDHDPSKSRDTVYRIVVSDDEFQTTYAQVVATPTSGTSSAGLVSDNGRATIYEIAEGPTGGSSGPAPGRLGIVYTRREASVPAEIWSAQLDNIGNPIGTPVKLTTVPRQAGPGTGSVPVLVGCSPIVQRLITGEYALYFTACDFDNNGTTGELHFMSCPPSAFGDPTKFVEDRLVSIVTNVGGGYGRAWPVPKPNGQIELIMAAAAKAQAAYLVSVIHYGAT
jgi:hypothetical protein